nr:PREDICTED: uncharacterized protein LOC108202480 isoform X1 [Daucus carota subsp. sativus]
MANTELTHLDPPHTHLVSAFLAMESPDWLLSLARVCGGGSVTESVQRFIWDHCISKAVSEQDGNFYRPYLKRFLKKLIAEVESTGAYVLEELYEQYATFMISVKDDDMAKGLSKILKRVSFLFPDDCSKSKKLVVPLQCSLNLLEGDTGCSIWPSSLFLSEFILSFPEIFSGKSCFEVGSGVGLVGICLAHVRASKMVKRLTETERRVVFHFLLERSTNGKLKNGSMIEASHKFSCSTSTVQRIWVQAKNSFGRGLPLDVSSKLKGRVGRKKIEIDRDEVSQVPLRRRTNIRSLACAINMAKSTLHRRIKEGGNIRSHTNAIKPHLTNENKMTRLAFCLKKLKRESLDTKPEFEEMFDVVHIDEKWFFQTKETERYYLLPEETDPVRTCKSKRFITKIMFLAAVARPQFDGDNNILFDGKIEIFPFVYKEPAQRSS